MFQVPIYLEGLRTRPLLVFWLAASAQAALWIAVPLLFYSAPPAEVAHLLAIGHEFPVSGNFGPPLAYWLAEIAFRAGGLFGVYVLSQLCVIATYWCVFAVGRSIVGATHAAMAVLLMVGIAVFAVPTPNFGPPILTMALWAAALLFLWHAVTEGRPAYWYALAGAVSLLLMTTDAALILLAALALFVALTARGRAAIDTREAWTAGIVVAVMLFAHVYLLARGGFDLSPTLERLRDAAMGRANLAAWLRLISVLVLGHAGLGVLVVLASGWPRTQLQLVPALARAHVVPLAPTFVIAFALVPVLLATIATVLAGSRQPIGGAAPLLIFSGLGVIMIAGDRIELRHQRLLGYAWAGLLLVPAIFVPIVMALSPWTTGTELKVAQPAAAMGRFFADSFARRTGHPLAVVGGDAQIAELIALAAPSRPSVYFAGDPAHSPGITPQDIRAKGAVIVWPTLDTDPVPPPDIKAHFPGLVPEVPQSFARPVRGRLPPLLIGWGVIRPSSEPSAQPR